MASILGLSFGYHDAAAALVRDGAIVAAMQEERFSRIKNDPSYPQHAIAACLKQGGITTQDIDRVVFYEDPLVKTERVMLNAIRYFPQSWKQFPKAISSQFSDKIWVVDQICSRLGIARSKVSCIPHHLSHAASCFLPSPFAEAAILTADGVGEHATTSIWSGKGNVITPVRSIHYPHSIGLLYAALTAYLGFEVNSGEYKAMGLAAFGTAAFKEEFSKLAHLFDDGSYRLNLSYFAHQTDTDIGFSPKLEKLLGPRCPPLKPWDLTSPEDRRYADIAASLQWLTETLLLHVARAARQLVPSDNLCIAGGVGLNCVANSRLLAESGFKRIFVQPAAGDAGGALGAALQGAAIAGDPRPAPLKSSALGLDIDSDRAMRLCKELDIQYTLPDDIHAAAAQLLAENRILAWARGRFEWGPRALGMRSILAQPKDSKVRDRLNSVIKKRELFRPFAPAILKEDASDWFEGTDDHMSPFMTSVARAKPAKVPDIEACVHVDGTSRVQTVTCDSSDGLYRLLQYMKRQTGLPVLLNTSFNVNRQPVIASAAEAMSFFLSTPIEAMVVGDLLVQKR